MRICLVLEASYPYVRGGVSSWVDEYIRNMPEHEFVLWTICDQEKKRGQFKYDLPGNVVHVYETCLDTALNLRVRKSVDLKITSYEKEAISQLIRCENPDWLAIHSVFYDQHKNPVEFLMSSTFLDILKEYCRTKFPFAGFADLFWTTRSMFLPLLYLIGQPIPEADMYHSISTGYAGVLGALASINENKPYVVTEHGIYTREREEEILLSNWIPPYFKSLWIAMFNMYSKFVYASAHRVTSLFDRASVIQQDMGCPPEKCDVVGNGIVLEDFLTIPSKIIDEWIDIGAIVRIAPIKDIKTMIYTFSNLKHEFKKARLYILGPTDDEEYHKECLSLINFLGVQDVILTGIVNTKDYLQKFDFTVLTSISEGQPFAIIESFAAGRPVVATNVGCCSELIEGEPGDNYGPAGICVPPMHQNQLLYALLSMCNNEKMRRKMGIAGQERAKAYFDVNKMINRYNKVYEKAVIKWQELDLN